MKQRVLVISSESVNVAGRQKGSPSVNFNFYTNKSYNVIINYIKSRKCWGDKELEQVSLADGSLRNGVRMGSAQSVFVGRHDGVGLNSDVK